MKQFIVILFLSIFCLALAPVMVFAQKGKVLETGDNVLDPNLDGFISLTNTGFSGDNFDVDEFEIKMFGIPIFGDGEALNDIQAGQPCGVVDIALDTAGYGIYAGYDANRNLIFRFRLAGNQQSVQSYTIFMDIDQMVGAADPNSNAINPGFEIEVTLIHKFGVFIYAVDGEDSCPTPLRAYDVATHQQKSVAVTESCDDLDVYIDFYVPFADLEELFGISEATDVRFAGVTNISATCALDGMISDIGGVDDTAYDGCFSCAILDLTENQCPSSVSNLCETCAGFPLGATETPAIDLPVIVGEIEISGTAEAEAEVYIELFSTAGILLDQDTINADLNGLWQSSNFTAPLNFGDSVVVNALLPGKCTSGALDTGLSFAIVSPNQPPSITGPGLTTTYIENDPPKLFGTEIIVTDDNNTLQSALITVSDNLQINLDILSASPPPEITINYDPATGVLQLTGEASVIIYQEVLRTVTFQNLSEAPSLNIRTIDFKVFDGTNWSQGYNNSIIITQQNDPPVVVVGSNPVDTIYVATQEDVPLSICIDAQDVDLDQLAVSSTALIEGLGSIALDEGLCVIYRPQSNFNGIEYAQIIICDDGTPQLCDTVIAAIQVEPVNDPPQILLNGVVTDSLYYSIEQAGSLQFCLDALDIDNDDLIIESISILTQNASSLSGLDGLCFSYSPLISFIGTDKAEITICDTGSPSRCTVVYVEIEVQDRNLPPQITTTDADTLFVEMFKNTTTEICLDVVDPDNDALDFGTLTDLLSIGGLTNLTYSCVNYTPPENYVGNVLLDISVCDNVTPPKCDNIVLKINVLPFNNPPQVVVEELPVDTVYVATDVNTPIDFCLEVTDPDNDNSTATEVSNDSGSGVFELDNTLCISYTPENDVTGDVFGTITICDDGDPSKCIETVVVVNISPVNDPPQIKFNNVDVDTIYYVTTKNVPIEFCIEAVDVNKDELSFESVKEIQSGGFYQPALGDLCFGFVPTTDFIGQAIHLITICDSGSPTGCDSVYVKVDVLNPNQSPRLLYQSVIQDTIRVSTQENLPIEVCLDASDPEGDLVTLNKYLLFSGEGSNTYTQSGNEFCFTYKPALGFFGKAYLEVEVCDDDQPQQCAEVIIEVEVTNENNAPEVYQNGVVLDTVRYAIPARTTLQECIEAIDKDGDALNIIVPGSSLNNALIESQIGELCFDYSPPNDFLGLDYFAITVCDNRLPALCTNAVVEIDVFSQNLAPQILYLDTTLDTLRLQAVENELIELSFEITDQTDDILALTNTELLLGQGSVEVNLESNIIDFSYTPAILSKGDHRIIMSVCDDGLPQLCAPLVIEIEVSEQEIFAFEAISPNDDGFNDYWVIQGIEHYPDNSIRIFDRWNNLVYTLDEYNNTDRVWRGKSNRGIGKTELNDGTYFYKITLSPGGDVLSGMVVLKR